MHVALHVALVGQLSLPSEHYRIRFIPSARPPTSRMKRQTSYIVIIDTYSFC
jgi:hypothetical protein